MVYKKSLKYRMVGLRWSYPETENVDGFIASFNSTVFTNTINTLVIQPTKCSAWPDYYCHTFYDLGPSYNYTFKVCILHKSRLVRRIFFVGASGSCRKICVKCLLPSVLLWLSLESINLHLSPLHTVTARTVTARTGMTKYYIVSLYELIHVDAADIAPSRYSTDRTDKRNPKRMF